MGQMTTIGKTATSVFTEDGWTKVVYHSTCVIKWNDKEIVLNSGGWRTATTKARINQAANQFGLDIQVFQRDFDWFVHDSYSRATNKINPMPFEDGMIIKR